ncbi:hypothetical protein [Sphingomonas sp. 28-62-20]|uniref:hypothetical protein n=1 Tax=Sphingomonas sp. 28-62-20 TaxID=1970433 RepID=UPI0035A914DE
MNDIAKSFRPRNKNKHTERQPMEPPSTDLQRTGTDFQTDQQKEAGRQSRPAG